jgi:tetratricopeptide (TPR) repeat protein
MKTFFVLALLFCPLSGLADDVAGPAPEEPGATIVTQKVHPDLLRLEQELSRKLDDKNDGRVTPEQYHAWEGEFRARLDAAITRMPPSPDNTAASARIMAQLGEGEAAQAALDQALEQNPKSPVLLTTKGQVLYDQKDFPGAAHNALQAWENSGRTDKGAWALYQMSKGRSVPSGTASASPGLSPLKQGSPVVTADDSNKPIKLAVKGSALPSAVPIPGQYDGDPIKRERGIPLWPLAVPFAGGLIAYGLYRAKQNGGGNDIPVDEEKTALMSAAVVTSGPAAEVVKGALRNGAQGAATSAVAAITITVATFGLIVGAGVATIYGLNQMIEAQDKYNEAIDTHRDDQPRPMRPAPIKNKGLLRPEWVKLV